AVIEIAAETFAAIDGVALAEAEQRHGDILAHAIDAIVERPGDQPGARHRRGGLGKNARGIEAGDEGFRAHHIGDEAGRDFRHVAGARGGQCKRAERGGGGEDEKQLFAGHDGLRLEMRPISPKPRPPARRIWKTASPNSETVLPISKLPKDYNEIALRPRFRAGGDIRSA